jgi:hypothetical protein
MTVCLVRLYESPPACQMESANLSGLVLDQGRIAEVEVPYKLWKQKNSAFREICDKSNITDADFTYRG